MELSKIQFVFLKDSVESKQPVMPSAIVKKCRCSMEEVNKAYQELVDLGYISDGRITPSGKNALESYRVKKAVFLAAGFGSRMVPITLNTPKPLVRVHGKRLIEGLLDACLRADIEEIYIVRGYLSEQFDQLLYQYPMIHFIDNPYYHEANNISSALLVKDLLSNAYVLEADLLLNNPAIIEKYHYQSNFLAIRKEQTDDWCFEVKDGIITEEKVGGVDCWQMVGISYWNAEDGLSLSKDIQKAYDLPDGKEFYWEQVPLKVFRDRYQVAVRECYDDDIIEIDTFSELKQIDPVYDV